MEDKSWIEFWDIKSNEELWWKIIAEDKSLPMLLIASMDSDHALSVARRVDSKYCIVQPC